NAKSIRFYLDHPDFPSLYIDKTISVPLTKELELMSEINLVRIPNFILEDRKSDWITEIQLDSIIQKQILKKAIRKWLKRLEFDTKEMNYYWIVFNTLYEEKCFSDEEILHIDPVKGSILK